MAQSKPVITTSELWANSALAPHKQKPTIGKIANGFSYGEKPPHNEFNWFFEATTQMLLHMQENGVPEWSNDIVYNNGALTAWDEKIYSSIQSGNNNKTPDLEPLWWEEFQGSGGGGGGTSTLYKYEFIASAGQTVFTCTYNPAWVYVSVSGIDLAEAEYTAADGATITLTNPASQDDVIKVFSALDVLAPAPLPGINVVYVNSNYSADVNELIVCDSQGVTLGTGFVAYNIVLPATPMDATIIRIMDGSGNSQNRPVLITRNGASIDGALDNITVDVNYFDIKLVYNQTTNNWSLAK